MVCEICGDGQERWKEECDEWSFCDDGTPCTLDLGYCAANGLGECKPRFINECTPTCRDAYCGDSYLSAWEECDDGNNYNWDGCTDSCTVEFCGDSSLDPDGVDNILGNGDDEQCDDGNNVSGDGCSDECKREFCGDGITDLDGPDNDISTEDDNELCDEGLYCDDGTPCTLWSSICPTECKPRFVNNCSPTCDGWFCGDTFVDADGRDNVSWNSNDEACDPWLYCPNGIACNGAEYLCPGECIARTQLDCSSECQIPTCGDSEITETWTLITIRDCGTYDNRCGDNVVDPDGTDNKLWTPDDEECDDGNTASGDGCSALCKYEFNTWGTNTCTNWVQDGDETWVDCGWSCQACNSCTDGIQNWSETWVDCGGACPLCATCDDNIKNGDETWVDCGWSCPNSC